MTPSEFKKIGRLLKTVYQELEHQALIEGVSVGTPQYDALDSGSTLNIGIRSKIASTATGGYHLYLDGTAPSYFNGNIGIKGLPTTTSPLNIQSLPTSSAGLATGDVWNNGGVLTIV